MTESLSVWYRTEESRQPCTFLAPLFFWPEYWPMRGRRFAVGISLKSSAGGMDKPQIRYSE